MWCLFQTSKSRNELADLHAVFEEFFQGFQHLILLRCEQCRCWCSPPPPGSCRSGSLPPRQTLSTASVCTCGPAPPCPVCKRCCCCRHTPGMAHSPLSLRLIATNSSTGLPKYLMISRVTKSRFQRVTIGSAAWLGPKRPSKPCPAMPVRPAGFLPVNPIV